MNVPRLSSGLACAAVATAAVVALPLSVAPTASAATATAGGSVTGPAGTSRPVEVTVQHSGSSLTEGTDIDYTVTVRNTTTRRMDHLQVAQMLSAAVLPAAISDGGRNTGTQVLWVVDLDPGQSRDLHVTGHLGTRAQLAVARAQGIQVKQPHSDAARHSADTLSSTACVQQADTRLLLGCASDSGTVQVNPMLAAGHDTWSDRLAGAWPWAVAAAAVLAVLATARTVVRRRGRSAAASGRMK
jgi:hypothetical protein